MIVPDDLRRRDLQANITLKSKPRAIYLAKHVVIRLGSGDLLLTTHCDLEPNARFWAQMRLRMCVHQFEGSDSRTPGG